MTRYAATKPTNQLQNSGIVLLRSGGVEAGITAEDVGRGYAVSLARTNETCSFAMPAGAVEARRWRIRGAVENCGIVELCNRENGRMGI